MSHSTSMPSAAKKPSSWATKSLRPMPLGATRTFLMPPPIDEYSGHYTPGERMIARRLSAKTLRGESARYERPSTEREAAILQAATRLFGDKGYRGTRTAEIAALAGVTERTLFRYFPSKDQL